MARGALQLAQTPVLGWERVETFTKGRKRPRVVIMRTSASVRAWELAVLGVTSVFVLGAFAEASNTTRPSDNPWLQLFGGLTAPFYKLAGR